MKAIETKLQGCFILEPTIFEDDRGYFFESYHASQLEKLLGNAPQFVQDNESKSVFGVVRGLHMQTGDHAQAKLVRVLQGCVIDVAVDVRKGSLTFGQHVAIELSGDNKKQLFIPRGFLHGFSVLSDSAVFSYKCDNFYHKDSESSVYPLDADLQIDWGISVEQIMLSEKDNLAESFAAFRSQLNSCEG